MRQNNWLFLRYLNHIWSRGAESSATQRALSETLGGGRYREKHGSEGAVSETEQTLLGTCLETRTKPYRAIARLLIITAHLRRA
jgi:hypothetical protein